jgi:hypothetical protein
MNNHRRNKRPKQTITVKDYLKAIRKADREIDLERQPGWKSVHKIFKNKKAYDRKSVKKEGWKEDQSVK